MPRKCDCFSSYRQVCLKPSSSCFTWQSQKIIWPHQLTKFRKQASLLDPGPVISSKDLFPEPRENPLYSVLSKILMGVHDIRVRSREERREESLGSCLGLPSKLINLCPSFTTTPGEERESTEMGQVIYASTSPPHGREHQEWEGSVLSLT